MRFASQLARVRLFVAESLDTLRRGCKSRGKRNTFPRRQSMLWTLLLVLLILWALGFGFGVVGNLVHILLVVAVVVLVVQLLQGRRVV